MLLFHFTSLLLGYSYLALSKPVLDGFDSLSLGAAFSEYPLTDGATPDANTAVSWVNNPPSSPNLLSEAESKTADTDSFTISESSCVHLHSQTRTNGKLRIRGDQAGLCKPEDTPTTTQPKVHVQQFTRPLPHATDYGTDYEPARPAVSPQDAALSQSDREKALMDQNKILGDNDPIKCTRAPFFIPVCCLGDMELMELMVEGNIVFERVPNCVSCKLLFLSL